VPATDLVFLHGWEGDLETYGDLPDLLHREGRGVNRLHLGRYATGLDDLSIDDFAIALHQAYRAKEFSRPFDVVVHSTGALVVRRWLSRFFRPGARSPIRKLIMAAPANNGSRLASWGKKLPWSWGNAVLDGLRLGSALTWELNCEWMRTQRHRRMRGLECYILQGCNSQIQFPGFLDRVDAFVGLDIPVFEERGSDNTVRYCASNLNMKGACLKEGQGMDAKRVHTIEGIPIFAFGDRNHFGDRHGILAAIRTSTDPVLNLIRRIVDDRKLPAVSTPDDHPRKLCFMMLNIRVVDQLGRPHENFVPRFYFDSTAEKKQIEIVHRNENGEIDCYYLRHRDLGRVSRFGFRIEANRIGKACYQESMPIDLLNPAAGIDFLEQGKTHFVQVVVNKSVDDAAMSFVPRPEEVG
jgi:pimeloyl-ACP methyl ester carboxylesterase